MPEHLDAITAINRDMFYCILVSKLPSRKQNLPPDHKISKKRMLTNYIFTWPYSDNIKSNRPLSNYTALVPASNNLKSRLHAKFSYICCIFSHKA